MQLIAIREGFYQTVKEAVESDQQNTEATPMNAVQEERTTAMEEHQKSKDEEVASLKEENRKLKYRI